MKRLKNIIAVFTLLLLTGNMAIAQPVIQGTWSTLAVEYSSNIGQRYTFNFPPGGLVTGQVWGTGIYTTHCSVASAAVHAGLITARYGGTVTIEILPGQKGYEGSIQNGVTSFDWGSFTGSFIFVNNKKDKPFANIIYADWYTKANEYSGGIGQRYTFYIPAGGLATGQVWGTGIYTADCSVASAAVHAGYITADQGGTVTIEIVPGQTSYKGTVQNGVSSSDWGYFSSSFIFVNSNRSQNWPATVIPAAWNTPATEYSNNKGSRYTFYFPPGGVISGEVWGTDVYTTDCSIASAAVHAGLITTEQGGTVTIEIISGQNAYRGSARNGITSNNWGSYGASFIFIRNNKIRK